MVTLNTHTLILACLLALGIVFISPFAMPLLLAGITAYVLYPTVTALRNITKSYNIALLISLLIIILPLAVLFRYVAGDMNPLIGDIAEFSSHVDEFLANAEAQFSTFGIGGYTIPLQDVVSYATDYLTQHAINFLQSIPRLLLNTAIYLFATYHFIKDGGTIVEYITKFINSLEKEQRLLLLSIMNGLRKSFDVLFISYITMAIIVAVLAWVGYYAIGTPYPGLLAFLSGLFSFLPILGVWMAYVPLALYEYYVGNLFAAAAVMLYGVIVLNLLPDLIIRPALSAKKAEVNPLTIFLGFFAGPIVVGPSGIIVGPIVFVLVETVVREYVDFVIFEKKTKNI